ncbi:MAG: glycerophosphodiester phosphodiesterase [Candidatus Hodarchaeales archaeon]|jgi:glycerophosphoryl diester phosphodiesterase
MTLIIAHRGYCRTSEPENSLLAFQTALDAKADGIEFDIHLSSDGHFVCFHDTSLTKLGRPEQICDLKLRDIIEIELSNGINIPSLEDIVERFGNKLLLNIELKPQKGGAEKLVQVIHQYNLENTPKKLIISSFHGEELKKIKTLNPDIYTGLLVDYARNTLPLTRKFECDALHPYYDKIPKGWNNLPYWLASWLHKYFTHKCFNEARNEGILVNPYTVNSDQYILNCFKRKVNGIITDDVELASQIKQQI